MKLHLRVAAALALFAVGTSAPSSRAAGLPYQMSGSVEEQARVAALQLASANVMTFNSIGLVRVGAGTLTLAGNTFTGTSRVGDNFNLFDWLQVGSLTSFNVSAGGDLDLVNLGGDYSWDTSLFNSSNIIYVVGGPPSPYQTSSGYILDVNATTVRLPNAKIYTRGGKLTSLTTSPEAFSPDFRNPYQEYSATVHSATTSLTVTPTLDGSESTTRILVNGIAVPSATASDPVPLTIGANTIKVEVQYPEVATGTSQITQAPVFGTIYTYFIRITRPERDVPEIGLRNATDYYAITDLAPGTKYDFGRVATGSSIGKAYTIRSTGTGDLIGVSVTIDGANASEFALEQHPAMTVARLTGTTTFSLSFSPTTSGRKAAVAHVWSNDEDESPFDIALEGIGGSQAEFNMSLPGNQLNPGSTSFSWDTGSGASKYVLWFGSAPGGYDRGLGTFIDGVTHTNVTSPGDGQPVYATLWTLVGDTWQSTSQVFRDYLKTKARMTRPANGSQLTSSVATFAWDAGIGVEKYALWLGTSAGARDIYSGEQNTNAERTVNVPANGGKIHATLYSWINGAWQSNSYVYTAAAPVAVTLDSNGSGTSRVLDDGRLLLQWGAGSGVSKRVVWIGSAYGGHDLAAVDGSGSNGDVFNVPADGGPVYVTLWSLINGAWQSSHSLFDAPFPQVTDSLPARLTSPSNTTTLGSTSVDFTWDAGVGATQYALWIGSQPDGYDLHSSFNGTTLSKNVTLPGDGRRVFVTLHSLINGAWKSNAYYFDSPTTPPPEAATITNPAADSTLTDASLALTWNDGTDVTSYALWVGSRPQGWDIYAAVEGTNHSRTVTVPTDGRPLYVTLHSFAKGAWLQTTQVFNATLTEGGKQKARLITPANGSTLTAAETTFTWDAGVGATGYVLWAGSAAGGYDALATTLNTDLTRTVTLPTDGRKLHVTLWSRIDNAWQSNSYLFTTAKIDPVKATMISPADGTTFTSSSATFTWNAGTKVSLYALWIGHTPGARDIHASSTPSGLTQTVTTLPTDGSPVYVTLWSLINGAWQSNEYIYNALLVQ